MLQLQSQHMERTYSRVTRARDTIAAAARRRYAPVDVAALDLFPENDRVR